MRRGAFLTTSLLVASIALIAIDLPKAGYMVFIEPQKLIVNSVPQKFAEILKGNDADCLTKPSQTKPVSRIQITKLRQLTDISEINKVLGNPFCQTAKGQKYLTESGKELTVNFDKILDYEFNTGATPKTLLSRPSKTGMASEKAK